MSLPASDPQFWIVTAAAGVALALLLRRFLRRPKSPSLPCAKCPKAGPPEGPRLLLVALAAPGIGAVLARMAAMAAMAAMALIAGGPAPLRAELVERDVAAMGTRLAMAIEAPDRPQGLAASAAIVAVVEDAERRLSTWRATSELADVQRRAGRCAGRHSRRSPGRRGDGGSRLLGGDRRGVRPDGRAARRGLGPAQRRTAPGARARSRAARLAVDAGRLRARARRAASWYSPVGCGWRRAASARGPRSTPPWPRRWRSSPGRRSSSTSAVSSPGAAERSRSWSASPTRAIARERCSS